ncbi:MAG: ABC transporter ATP-binding protein [Thermoanaerobacteraceae bacterium]
MIEFKNVKKSFKNTHVLKNITMTINDEELVVLIGPSGCGKTTTLKMINKLIEPTEGKIYINGRDISKEDTIKLRRNIGYVIQQTGLFPHMTIGKNIEIVPFLNKWPASKRHKRAEELLHLVGMDPSEYINRYPNELSGGQQQRIGVARALATNPDIILMDEPFSALDPITRNQLQDELFKLQQELKKTIVFVTHDMDEALKLGDRICIMKDGEILRFDTPENLLREPGNDFVEEFIGKNRIWRQPEFIKAEDIMIKNPVKAIASRTIPQALQIMTSNKVDSLMIVDNKDNLIGIVTAKDIARNRDKGIRLEDIIEKNVIYVTQDTSIVEILKLMNEKSIGYIPVVEEDKKLVGLITKSSILTIFNEQVERV